MPETLYETRPVEHWVGPHRLYVEGREPVGAPADRPAILFTGGAFDGSWIFRREIEYLSARGWRVFALNLRGYFKSLWQDVASLTVEDYLNDILTVRQSLNLEQVILSGFSMGGLLAAKHAEQHGAAAMILYDSDASREIWEALGLKRNAHHVQPVARFWPAPEIVREMWGGWVSKARYREFLELFKQTSMSGRAFEVTEYGGLSVDAEKIHCPALLIGIRRDARVQEEWFRRLHATWLVFEGNSHGSILVGPRSLTITEEVTRWLDSGFSPRGKKIFPPLGVLPGQPDWFRMRLFYFSGWKNPEVEIQPPNRRPAIRVKMERAGNGRNESESLHEATLVLNRRGGFFIREGETHDRPLGRGLYRPLAREGWLADGEFFHEWPPAGRSGPEYINLEVESNDLRHKFRVHLLLPRNYRRETQPYPVCVLNDGQNQWKNQGAFGGWHTDAITSELAKKGRCRDVVLVGVESTRLHRSKYYLTPPIGRADLYVNFLADVLLPRLRRDFHLSARSDEIGIVGASYGANCAVYAGMKRPDVFGLVGSLSYTPLKGRPLRSWMERLPRLPFRRLYIDCGTRWTPEQKGSRTDNTQTSKDLARVAQAKGMTPGRNLMFLVAQGHCHREPFWRKRVGGCIEFLFTLV